jgi:hypothetical protein
VAYSFLEQEASPAPAQPKTLTRQEKDIQELGYANKEKLREVAQKYTRHHVASVIMERQALLGFYKKNQDIVNSELSHTEQLETQITELRLA